MKTIFLVQRLLLKLIQHKFCYITLTFFRKISMVLPLLVQRAKNISNVALVVMERIQFVLKYQGTRFKQFLYQIF